MAEIGGQWEKEVNLDLVPEKKLFNLVGGLAGGCKYILHGRKVWLAKWYRRGQMLEPWKWAHPGGDEE